MMRTTGDSGWDPRLRITDNLPFLTLWAYYTITKHKVLGYLLYLRVKNLPGAFLEFVQIHGTAIEWTE